MATNNSNSTHNNTSHNVRMPVPVSQCIPWLVVLITECLAIVILNIITIIVFVKQRQLQRRSTYLIIHLAIVDLLVGAVTAPLHIESRMAYFCDLWAQFGWGYSSHKIKWAFSGFHVLSLCNLAAISIERLHATLFPFRHRFIKKWVYGVIILIIWLTCFGPQVAVQLVYTAFVLQIVYLSYVFIPLLVIFVAYVCIVIKLRCSRHPQHHGAAGLRERKLTRTLFIVTLGSLLTWLPLTIENLLPFTNPQSISRRTLQTHFHVHMTLEILYFANSLINPIIYALRMPELRAGLSELFRRNPNRQSNPVDLPLQNL